MLQWDLCQNTGGVWCTSHKHWPFLRLHPVVQPTVKNCQTDMVLGCTGLLCNAFADLQSHADDSFDMRAL